jgi:DNA mismatch repair protein MSH5
LSIVKTFIEPTVVLVSVRIDDAVINCFDPEARSSESVSGDNDQFRLPFLLEMRPPSEFSYDSAKIKLVSLPLDEDNGSSVRFHIPGELIQVGESVEDGTGQQGRLLRLAGRVDIDSRTTVCV